MQKLVQNSSSTKFYAKSVNPRKHIHICNTTFLFLTERSSKSLKRASPEKEDDRKFDKWYAFKQILCWSSMMSHWWLNYDLAGLRIDLGKLTVQDGPLTLLPSLVDTTTFTRSLTLLPTNGPHSTYFEKMDGKWIKSNSIWRYVC